MDTNITTDNVELALVDSPIDSDNKVNVNMPIVGAALIGGALLGKYVVPPVVGFVKGLFNRSQTEEVVEIEAAPETPKAKKAV
jgi:hypothetical protein